MQQGPYDTNAALESGGNLEKLYESHLQAQAPLLRDILIELRVISQLLQAGLNTADQPETLRADAQTDITQPSILDS